MRKLLTIGCNLYFQQYFPRLRENAAPYFDEVECLTDKDLSADWRAKHLHIMHQVGHGAFSWKPGVILRAIEPMGPDDFLMWLDSTSLFVADPSPLFDACKAAGGIFAAHNNFVTNGAWTRRDTFVRMGCDEPKYHHAYQTHATFHIWQITARAIQVLREWAHYCDDIGCVRYGPSNAPNLPEYIDHRSDQSILSILLAKHGYALHEDPSQRCWTERKAYPQILEIQSHDLAGKTGIPYMNGARY